MTRDSWTWIVAAAAALVGYLLTTQTPPTQWAYLDWLNFAAFILAWLAGKMAVSPLTLSDKGRDRYLYPKMR